MADAEHWRPAPLRPRPPDAHKGTMGRCVIVGGSPGLTGAVALCAHAAMRSGVGLVTCAVPRTLNAIIEVKTTEAMSLALADDGAGNFVPEAIEDLRPLLDAAHSLIVGPGIGRTEGTGTLLASLLATVQIPHVVDADALWHLARAPNTLSAGHPKRVLTPHTGEMRRLLGGSPEVVNAAVARAFAVKVPGVLVLKGPGTLVVAGTALYRNATGNPGMATGGAGDVLAGIIGAFLARGDTPFDAAVRGVYLHGLAGDLAAARVGPESLIASDLVDALPHAFEAFRQASLPPPP